MEANQSQFDGPGGLYWLHQPDAVRMLEKERYPDSAGVAMDLATQGYAIDVPIMVYGWSPFLVMSERIADGYTWVPNALQPRVQIAPGLTAPGSQTYDPDHPPVGSIKVSLDPADYAPFDPPVAPPVVAPQPPGVRHVGPKNAIGIYISLIPLALDGDDITEGGVIYTFHRSRTPFATKQVVEWYTLSS